MNKSKKILSLCLAVLIVFGVAPLGISVIKTQAADTTYQNGDIIEFGSYPQSEVKDSALLSELNKLSKAWISYGYYSGMGDPIDGYMTAKDYMKYADVTYNENEYRAVTFSSYRPYYTGYTSSYTYQDVNGYMTNTVYWFKYEPVKWRVLNSSTGLVICETIIDSQAYNNYLLFADGEYFGISSKTYYANNYEKSSIREWLNDDFYNTAFTSSEKSKINTTVLNNSAFDSRFSKYDSASTTDKVFLLSYNEADNMDYFENGVSRQARSSDYSKCQGLYVYSENNCSGWYLRTAGYNARSACCVDGFGDIYSEYGTSLADLGIRPAIRLDFGNNQEPVEITFKNLPVKTEYIYKRDKLDLSGIELLITYLDGSIVTVTDISKMTASGFSNTVRGEQTVTVECEGLQTSFKVNVKYAWWQWIIVILIFGWIWY